MQYTYWLLLPQILIRKVDISDGTWRLSNLNVLFVLSGWVVVALDRDWFSIPVLIQTTFSLPCKLLLNLVKRSKVGPSLTDLFKGLARDVIT